MANLRELDHGHILAEIAGIGNGDHVCVLYDESADEWAREIGAFLAEGLANDEQCFYVWDESPPEKMLTELATHGIDAEAYAHAGALKVWTGHQWQESDTLDALRKAAQVREWIERAFLNGFKGVRFAVEMTWSKRPDITPRDLEDWEAHSDTLLDKLAPVRVMCLYGRERLTPALIHAGLVTHPLVLDRDGLRST